MFFSGERGVLVMTMTSVPEPRSVLSTEFQALLRATPNAEVTEDGFTYREARGNAVESGFVACHARDGSIARIYDSDGNPVWGM